MTAPAAVYQQRRTKLAAHLSRPMVIFAGEPRARHYATNVYPFRAGSSYLYFGGPPVPGAALLIEPDSDGKAGISLVRSVGSFEVAVWFGETPSDAALASASGLQVADLIPPDQLMGKLGGRSASFVAPPCIPTHEWVQSLGLEAATPDEIQPIIDLRLIKDEHELEAMRFAAKVGVKAHRAAMAATIPGKKEADVFAAFVSVLASHRCDASFTPIVTVHGEVLHTDQYPGTLESGRLLLVDAGAEEPGGYASDITRTYPVNGRFTPVQRHMYETVLRAQQEAIAACVPGKRFRDVHDLAARVICEGLIDAELLKGDADDLVARAAHALFFTHGLGHLIGLDVHDLEDFGDQAGYAPGRTRREEFGSKFLRLDRDLLRGMALTIEPGFYAVPAIWRQDELIKPLADCVNRSAVDQLLADGFGGIRIEETICVRESGGPEVLSADLPNDPDELTALVGTG